MDVPRAGQWRGGSGDGAHEQGHAARALSRPPVPWHARPQARNGTAYGHSLNGAWLRDEKLNLPLLLRIARERLERHGKPQPRAAATALTAPPPSTCCTLITQMRLGLRLCTSCPSGPAIGPLSVERWPTSLAGRAGGPQRPCCGHALRRGGACLGRRGAEPRPLSGEMT